MMNGLNGGNPFNFQAPNVNMGAMFNQAQRGLRGGGYPGGPNFGIAPEMAGRNIAMQNAMFGMDSARNRMNYNLGLAGQTAQWNREFNPTLFDFLGTGVAGMNALGAYGNRMQNQQTMGMPDMGGWQPMGGY